MNTPGPFLAVVLVCAVIAAAVAEIHSLRRWNASVKMDFRIDMRLTEPGEAATLTYQISSASRWPMPHVSVSFLFDKAVEVLEDWEDGEENYTRNLYNVDTALRPRQACRGTIRISFRERGVHQLGRVFLETGDFLGLRSVIRAFDIPLTVICTAKRVDDQTQIEPMGGFLGDISVRRFILEDPSMILGYREYTGVEPMKSISWLQTARTGKLMVKQHDFTVDTDVAILVDVEAVKKAQAEHCLSLVRSVCDELERRQIPYVIVSNGDLQFREKGVGRSHCFELQRRIGVCRYVRRLGFRHVLAACAADGARKGYIVAAPLLTEEITAGVRRLRAATGTQVCVLTGKEEEDA